MINFEEAQKIMSKNVELLDIEEINFQESLGRILARDIFSDVNMPPFDKSAMDGYACRAEDIANELEVVEIIPAGYVPQKKVGKNQCSKIMTGAMVPEGANMVIIVENTEKTDENHIRFFKEKSSSNICYFAEDVKISDLVLKKGTKISSTHIPVLASVGAVNIKVYKKPRIAIITTGSELVEPENIPEKSQIRNSNAYSILALLKEIGIEANYHGITKDTKEATHELLKKAAENSDIIIFSGAVSMGDFDFVPEVLKEEGVEILFHGINVKPGKKTIFGKRNSKYFIGVPGNPVSAFIQIKLLIIPFIFEMMGHTINDLTIKLPLAQNFIRKHGNRKEFIPVFIENNNVKISEYHGSAHINAYSYVNGIMEIEREITEIKKGELVNVRLL